MIRPRCAPGEGVCIFVLHWQMSDFNNEMMQNPREKIQLNRADLIFKQSINSMDKKNGHLAAHKSLFFGDFLFLCIL